MTWLQRARELARWPGWRRHAPAAAGSAVAHLAIVGIIALGVAAGSPAEVDAPPEELFLALDLIPPELEPVEVAAGVTPTPRAATPKPDDVTPSSPPPDPRKRAQEQPGAPPLGAPSEPSGAPDGDSVYIPPGVTTGRGPPGLASLMQNDRCSSRIGPRPRDCPSDLGARVGTMDTVMPRSEADLARHYGDFMPTCALRVGCGPDEHKTILGTAAAARPAPGSANDRGAGTPHAGGASSLGGLHDSVGRLGFNPDHRDPGFGD